VFVQPEAMQTRFRIHSMRRLPAPICQPHCPYSPPTSARPWELGPHFLSSVMSGAGSRIELRATVIRQFSCACDGPDTKRLSSHLFYPVYDAAGNGSNFVYLPIRF